MTQEEKSDGRAVYCQDITLGKIFEQMDAGSIIIAKVWIVAITFC